MVPRAESLRFVAGELGKNGRNLEQIGAKFLGPDRFGVFFQNMAERLPTFSRFREYWKIGSELVCVCVFFPFILDINGRTSRGHTGGRSHMIFHPPSFCGACLYFSREKDSAIPFRRRP